MAKREAISPSSAPNKKKQKNSRLQKADERKCKMLANKLVKEWKFRDSDLAYRFACNGVAKALLQLDKEGFKCSESDPLLIISVNLTSADSIGYFNQGNYGVSPATAGYLAGPNVGQQGPSAVGEFLNSYEGVEDKSGGYLTVLYFESMGKMHAVQKEFVVERQFYRLGPVMSTRFAVPQEDPLVEFFTLDKMKTEPMPYENFNMTP